MIKLFKYLKPFLLSIIIAIIFVALQATIDLKLPEYMSDIINNGVIKSDVDYIIKTGLIMLCIALIGGLSTILVGYFGAKVSSGFARNLRTKVFSKIESFSMAEFNKFTPSSLITRTTNDITQIQEFIFMAIRLMVMAPIMGGGALYKIITKNESMGVVVGGAILAIFVVMIFMIIVVMPKFKLLQVLTDKLNLIVREGLTGIRVIRAFGNEKHEEQKFAAENKKLMNLNLFINRIMVLLNPYMTLIMSGTSIAIVWFGSHMIDSGTLNIGDMMAFMQYSIQVMISFIMLSMMFILIPRAEVSAGRINEILRTECSIKDDVNPISSLDNNGTIEFKNVSFKHGDSEETVLNNLNFKVASGKTTAIIGSTGSGKSTIINLIMRFYDVTNGEIIIDGINIQKMKLETLRNKIGYVPQKGMLFSGSVLSNLKYGKRNATKEEAKEALEVSEALNFVMQKPKQLNAHIAQGATNVSGGQKQRLSIARAIIKKPEIIVFDDSFSALDYKTDIRLRNSLHKYLDKTTIIIVAQRINTIRNADQIIVLDKGNIVGIGKHQDLLKKCKVYKEIALSQLSKEELA